MLPNWSMKWMQKTFIPNRALHELQIQQFTSKPNKFLASEGTGHCYLHSSDDPQLYNEISLLYARWEVALMPISVLTITIISVHTLTPLSVHILTPLSVHTLTPLSVLTLNAISADILTATSFHTLTPLSVLILIPISVLAFKSLVHY